MINGLEMSLNNFSITIFTFQLQKATHTDWLIVLVPQTIITDSICQSVPQFFIFSSPGQSPGRAIVLPPALAAASAFAKKLMLKFYM